MTGKRRKSQDDITREDAPGVIAAIILVVAILSWFCWSEQQPTPMPARPSAQRVR